MTVIDMRGLVTHRSLAIAGGRVVTRDPQAGDDTRLMASARRPILARAWQRRI
jgi:hypothetical protein